MALYKANITFSHGGNVIRKGDIIDSTSSYLYTMFPTRFTLVSGATLTSPLGTVYTLAISEDGGTITAS